MSVILPSQPLGRPAARELARLVRFGAVGVSGVVVNFAALWLLAERVHLALLVASCIATELAILSNFALNHVWTFSGVRDGEPVARKLAKFNAVALGGLAMSLTALWLLTRLAGLHYLAANGIGIGAATAWNYVANRRWTWSGAA